MCLSKVCGSESRGVRDIDNLFCLSLQGARLSCFGTFLVQLQLFDGGMSVLHKQFMPKARGVKRLHSPPKSLTPPRHGALIY
jgi:hypothetical protein